MSETRLSIEITARDLASANLRLLEAEAVSLTEKIKGISAATGALIAQAGGLNNMSSVVVQGILGENAALEARLRLLREQIGLQQEALATASISPREEYYNVLNQAAAEEHARVAQQRAASPFQNIGSAARLESAALSASALKASSSELEHQIALERQLGLTASEFSTISSAQLTTRLNALKAESDAMRRQEADFQRFIAANIQGYEKLSAERLKFASQIAPRANIAEQRHTEEAQRTFASRVAPQERIADHNSELRKQTAELKQLVDEQVRQYERLQAERFNFAQQMAPRSDLRGQRILTPEAQEAQSGRATSEASLNAAIAAHDAEEAILREAAADETATAAAMARRESLQSLEQAEARLIAQEAQRAAVTRAQAQRVVSPIETESVASIAAASTSFEALSSAGGRAGASMQAFSRQAASARGAANSASVTVRGLGVEFSEMARHARGQQIGTLISTLRRLGAVGSLPFLAGFAAVFGAIHLEGLISQFGTLAERTTNAAAAAGMSVAQYSLLQRTLQILTGDSEKLTTVFGTLSQSIESALTDPGGRQGSAFARILGPNWDEDLRKLQSGDFSTAISTFNQRFHEMGANLQTVETFRAAFGRGWQELAPIFRASADELAHATEGAKEAGAVFTEQTAESFRKAGEEAHILGENFTGLGLAIAGLAAGTGLIDWSIHAIQGLREVIESVSTLVGWVGRLASLPGTLTPAAQAGYARTQNAIAERPFRDQTGQTIPIPPATVPIPPRPQFGPPVPPEVQAQLREHPALSGPFEASKLEEEMNRRVRVIQQETEIRSAEYGKQIADAERHRDRMGVLALETQRENFVQRQLQRETETAQPYISRVQTEGGPALAPQVERMKGVTTQVQREQYDAQAQAANRARQVEDQNYQDFAQRERLKLAAAQGNVSQINQIYQEWEAEAARIYGSDARQFEEIQRDHVKAAQEATDKILQDRLRVADETARVNQTQERAVLARSEIQQIGSGGSKIDKSAAIRQEKVMLEADAGQEIEAYQAIANSADASAETKIAALDKAASVAEQTYSREIELAKTAADEQKKQAEETAKAFTSFFDSAGDTIEKSLNDAILGSRNRVDIFKELLTGLDKTLLHTGETLFSQFAAQGLAKITGTPLEPGKGLGDLLGNMVGKLFGTSKEVDHEQVINALTQNANNQRTMVIGILQQIREALTKQSTAAETIKGGAPNPLVQNAIPADVQDSRALSLIEHYESGGRNIKNPASSASGYYQMLDPTWREFAPKVGVSPAQYPTAMSAPREAQTRVATELYHEQGFSPWADYNPRLQAALNNGAASAPVQVDLASVGGTQVVTTAAGAIPTQNPNLPIPLAPPPGSITPSFHEGGVARLHSGGFPPSLKSGEIPAILHERERVLNPTETAAYAHMFPNGILGSQKYHDGGGVDLPRFAQGGQAPTFHGFSSPMTVPTISGGLTTESRGFVSPYLQPVYPGPNWKQLLAVLGAGAGAIAAIAGLTKELSPDDQKAQVKKLLAAPSDAPDSGNSAMSKATPLGAADDATLAAMSNQETTGLTNPPLPHFAEGGSVIQFPISYSDMLVQKSRSMLQAQMEEELAKPSPDHAKLRDLEAQHTMLGLPRFHNGGLAHDEVPAVLLSGERVLNRSEALSYDRQFPRGILANSNNSDLSAAPRFHSGGVVWRSFDEGGTSDGSVGGSQIGATSPGPSSNPGDSSAQSAVTSLSSNLANLSGSVDKVSSGLSNLEKAAQGASGGAQSLGTSLLGTVSSVASSLNSILSIPKNIMSAFQGIGSIFSFVGSIFALEGGGIIPSFAQGGMVGGLPKLAGGGILSVLHQNEMVLPSRISQVVQNAANHGAGPETSGVQVHIGSINGVMNAHDVDSLLMSRFGAIAGSYQRAFRNNYDLPG